MTDSVTSFIDLPKVFDWGTVLLHVGMDWMKDGATIEWAQQLVTWDNC